MVFWVILNQYMSTRNKKYCNVNLCLGCIILSNAGSLVGAFMPDYWSYFTLRMVTAIGAGGLYMSAFTLTVELVGSKQVCWKIYFLTSNIFSSKYNQIDTDTNVISRWCHGCHG